MISPLIMMISPLRNFPFAFVDKGDCSENHFFAGCSCSHGTKGRNCVHVLGAYMRSGVLELPSRLARNQNQRGKLPNAKKIFLHNLLNVLFLLYYFITLPYYFIALRSV